MELEVEEIYHICNIENRTLSKFLITYTSRHTYNEMVGFLLIYLISENVNLTPKCR